MSDFQWPADHGRFAPCECSACRYPNPDAGERIAALEAEVKTLRSASGPGHSCTMLAARLAEVERERDEWKKVARQATDDAAKRFKESATLRARVAELEGEVRILSDDCHDGGCRACARCCDDMAGLYEEADKRADAAEARVEALAAERKGEG